MALGCLIVVFPMISYSLPSDHPVSKWERKPLIQRVLRVAS